MIAVLDVSAAVEIILKKPKRNVFYSAYESASWILAPDLYVSEISNTFWKYFKANLITHDDCVQFVSDGIGLIDDFVSAQDLWKEALGEGIRNTHPIYDMYYSVLARRNDATLITNDGRLAEIAETMSVVTCK